ncbi:TetR/AcrR family transcriptional regulator [uncultured Brevibacillus sp.]|uniref:TetR/AcrR family transcriptional regulator n=1 Tax=uncultured Brevibacillus sp. TaxID=169970 RepID=UPI00259185F1|nr:TetR/AcrR family transcriptional regulator [uncultured Brevibacillus sp.]
MVRPREFQEDKALEKAMLLFWEKGYEATSLSDLTTSMGIQKPSIYAAFGDKKELFEAALRKYIHEHATFFRRHLQSGSSVKEAIHTLFQEIVAQAYQDDRSRGCFCINTMVELAPHEPRFEVLTREHQLYLTVIFLETIERGKKAGELQPHINAKALANTLVVSLIGLTVMMKSRPDRTFVDQSVETVMQLLD